MTTGQIIIITAMATAPAFFMLGVVFTSSRNAVLRGRVAELDADLSCAKKVLSDRWDRHQVSLGRIKRALDLIASIPHRKGKEAAIRDILRGDA